MLIEALVAGVPVIVSDICGYAFHVSQAQAGVVIDEPFTQAALNTALNTALSEKTQLASWQENAIHYANTADLYSLPEKAADIILGNRND